MDSVSVPAVAVSVAIMILGGGAPLAAAHILNWRERRRAASLSVDLKDEATL